MENKIKAIFFDFDMTLVNSMKGARETYRALCKLSKIKPTEKGFDEYIGRRVSESLAMFTKNKDKQKQYYKIFLKVFIKEIPRIRVYGRELLKYLKKNRIKVVIVSHNSRRVIESACKTHRLHYKLIIADENMLKGEKKHEAIKRTLKKLKLNKNEIFYVGDHINDIKEGKKAGVRVISVTTGVFSKKQLEKYHPFRIIKNLNEIKKIIE